MSERINYRERWHENMRAWGEKRQEVWDQRVLEMLAGPPDSGKPITIHPWKTSLVQMITEEQKIQAVTEAKAYVNAFSQWLIDHPGEAPTQEMIDRFKKDNAFLAAQYP